MLRQRQQRPPRGVQEKPATHTHSSTPDIDNFLTKSGYSTGMDGPDDPRQPLLRSESRGAAKLAEDTNASLSGRHVSSSASILSGGEEGMEKLSRKSQWILLAIASGGCAAFNGVFAKLTTTELTTTFATSTANLLGLSNVKGGVEFVVRALFFALNLIFNGIMWTLFTKALARGTSTTQVSILNTSSNFMLTAILGFLIFSESLPPMWFVGAALLVAGNVIIGRREEGESKPLEVGDEHHRAENGEGIYNSEEEELLVGEGLELDTKLEVERKRKEDEDLADLDLDGLDEMEKRSPRLI